MTIKVPASAAGGVGFVVAALEGRNFARELVHDFAGCHSATDVGVRLLQMKDEQFLMLIIAVLVILSIAGGLWTHLAGRFPAAARLTGRSAAPDRESAGHALQSVESERQRAFEAK